MAFIVLRRSRNTRSYYLVESYRDDQGKVRRRTLCYLGRDQDGTETLAKALEHWEQAMATAKRELRKAGAEHREVLRRRIDATRTRIGVITEHMRLLTQAEAERKKREQQAEEALYWQSSSRCAAARQRNTPRPPSERFCSSRNVITRTRAALTTDSCGSRMPTIAHSQFGGVSPRNTALVTALPG